MKDLLCILKKGTSLIIVLGLFVFTPQALAAGRVSPDPASATLAEDADTKSFTITLDEPILSSGLDPGYATINFSVDDSRLQLSTTSITFASATWSEPQSFVVTTIGDSIHNLDNEAVITLLTVSNSEYYSNFRNTIPIALLDDDSAQKSRRKGQVQYGCKDTAALNYEYFVASKPSLCTYAVSAPSTPKAPQPLNRDLGMGAVGGDVSFLQEYLIQRNIGPSAQALAVFGATGYFGNVTKEAVVEFQKSEGILPATGVFGPKSRARASL